MPHPDQIIVDPIAGSVKVRGPLADEEKAEWDQLIAMKADRQRQLTELEAERRAAPRSRNLKKGIEAIRSVIARIDEILNNERILVQGRSECKHQTTRRGEARFKLRPPDQPSSALCASQLSGRSPGRFSRSAVSASGWVPSRMPSTRSGARKASGSDRETSPTSSAVAPGDGADAERLRRIEPVGDAAARRDQRAHEVRVRSG